MRTAFLLFITFLAGCSSKQSPAPTAVQSAQPAPPPAAQPLTPEQRAESPGYARWAKFPVGSVAVLEETTDVGGQKSTTQTTYRLTKLTEDVAVVETGGLINSPGVSVQQNEPSEVKHLRWMIRPKGQAAEDLGRPQGTYATGTESVTVRGKEYKTVWYKSKGRVEAGETDTQTWFSPDVPGGIVKTVHQIAAIKKTVTAELVEVKKP